MTDQEKNQANRAAVVGLLEEMEKLLQLRGENPFKVRAYERAASVIEGLPETEDLAARAKSGTLTQIEGIGKGIAEVLTEFLLKGSSSARDELRQAIPPALLELTRIPGLGPKKAQVLIDELKIGTIGELEYACRENRLLKIKGFGDKAQHKILEAILFLNAQRGQQRLDQAFPLAEEFFKRLYKTVNAGRHPAAASLRVSETGELRRRREVLTALEYLVELPLGEVAPDDVRTRAQNEAQKAAAEHPGSLPIRIEFAGAESFGSRLAMTTASPEHRKAIGLSADESPCATEEELYTRRGLPFFPPEVRETGEEVNLAREGKLELLPWDGIKGVFHNHTTRSDGTASLEQMVVRAKELGYQYIGISDHSQSAYYAQGLRSDALKAQYREVQEVQARYPEIRVFWGIESDILADGSLDYTDEELKRFDFVIASVHSRFQMDRDTMTDRILEAVRNPFTRFLGHATGRLLLGRKGYDVDLEKIIAEAARHDVAIELNCNPARLDIDWRWGGCLRAHGARISVNPDAHGLSGLEDVRFGVAMARKALMPPSLVVNSLPVDEVSRWLARS